MSREDIFFCVSPRPPEKKGEKKKKKRKSKIKTKKSQLITGGAWQRPSAAARPFSTPRICIFFLLRHGLMSHIASGCTQHTLAHSATPSYPLFATRARSLPSLRPRHL